MHNQHGYHCCSFLCLHSDSSLFLPLCVCFNLYGVTTSWNFVTNLFYLSGFIHRLGKYLYIYGLDTNCQSAIQLLVHFKLGYHGCSFCVCSVTHHFLFVYTMISMVLLPTEILSPIVSTYLGFSQPWQILRYL
jgi:hypothetical protein